MGLINGMHRTQTNNVLLSTKGDPDSSSSAAKAAEHLRQCLVFDHKVQVAVVVPLRAASFGTKLLSFCTLVHEKSIV